MEIDADAVAKLSLSLGQNTEAVNKSRTLALRSSAPVLGRLILASTVQANGFAAFGAFQDSGPSMGYFWYVRNITITGDDPSVTVAGTGYIYVGASYPLATINTIAGLNAGDLRDRALSFPAIAFYGRGELPLRLNEELTIAVAGAPSGQQMIATVQYEMYQESANLEGFGGR